MTAVSLIALTIPFASAVFEPGPIETAMISYRIRGSSPLHPGQDQLVLNGPEAGLTAAKVSVVSMAEVSLVPERADRASLVVLTEVPVAA